jgi:phosphohistidine phosphatase
MIHLYLVRHGIARDAKPGERDESRPLTGEGRDRFRKMARAFARLGESPDFLLTSPLVRAVQTAEILAEALGQDQVEVLPQLAPEVVPADLFAELAKTVKDGQSAVLVGHDPQMSSNVAFAAGLSPQDSMRVDFRKGAIVRIDVKGLPKTQPAQPRWWMRPKRRELVKGLPLLEPKAQQKTKKADGKDKKAAADADEGEGGTA